MSPSFAHARLGILILFLAFHLCKTSPTLEQLSDLDISHVVVEKPPPGEAFFADAKYNEGSYGGFVTHTFKSTNITAPRFNMMKNFSNCDDGSYIFVAPRGETVEQATAAIFDAEGSLVWMLNRDLGQIYNFEVQQYQNHSYLTFWAGNNSGGHGAGHYYMYDQHYRLTRKISAANGLSADLHSFSILSEGSALLTVYEKVMSDLAGVRARPPFDESYVWDCLFQEIDLRTGNVTFQWRASDHFELTESYTSFDVASAQQPWDWFHINMVEKDPAGNYLVSARHLRCIFYVSGETGEVIWRLGGMKNMFRDLSGGNATQFVGQHDAHWDEGQKFVTLFDNRADWQDEAEHVSRGKRVELDVENMTAKINETFTHPDEIFGFSQGSYQTLPNHDVLLGYGFTAAISQFSPDGTLLCDAYLQPSSRFGTGDVQSYRSLKSNWTGTPNTSPDVAFENATLYVSWLGSTEVRAWWLQDSHAKDGPFAPAVLFHKTGFETQLFVSDDLLIRRYLRIAALNKDRQTLAVSPTVDIGNLATVWTPIPESEALQEEVVDNPNISSIEEPQQGRQNNGLMLLLSFTLICIVSILLLFMIFMRPSWTRRCLGILHYREQLRRASLADQLKEIDFWRHLESLKPRWRYMVTYHPMSEIHDDSDSTSSSLEVG